MKKSASIAGTTWICIICAVVVISLPVQADEESDVKKPDQHCKGHKLHRGQPWHNRQGAKGKIPIFITSDRNLASKKLLNAAFFSARQEFEKVACIRFEPTNSMEAKNSYHLNLYVGTESHAPVGMHNSTTKEHSVVVNGLTTGSVFLREVLHELAHALGLYHEFSRPDRDQYVRIINNNHDGKYCKYTDTHNHPFNNLPFDYSSITNYHGLQRKDTGEIIQQMAELSDCDKYKLYLLYPPTPENAAWCNKIETPVCQNLETSSPSSSSPLPNTPSSASQPTSFLGGLWSALRASARAKLYIPHKVTRP